VAVPKINCLKCGAPLPPGAIEGFCDRCLAEAAFGGEPANASEDPADSSTRRLGRYELLEEIGRGGMGFVYRARQTGLGREVAIKVMREGPFAGPQERERFRREAAAAARLRHPNIVAVFEEGEVDGHAYFSMELVCGQTLAQLTQNGPLEPGRAARYAFTIASAVESAHAAGILHRDLKPANVLIDAQDEPRITDFGLAMRLDLEDATLTQGIIGSPGYMSPEQAEPQRGPLGVASDVYSLGALLYQLLTGRPPFAGASAASTLAQVLNNDPVPPRQLNSAVPLDLETICLKCLEKNPAKRYPTALALAEDLKRFLKDQPIQGRPVSRTERLWRWCRRQPVVAGLSGGVLLLLLVVAVGSSIAALRISKARIAEHDERERAVTAGRRLTESNERLTDTVRLLELQRAEDLLTAGNSSTAIAHLAEIARRDPSNHVAASRLVSGLIHRSTAILAVPPLKHQGPISAIDVKADGASLLVASSDGVAQLWFIPSGQPVGPPMTHSSPITAAKFSPDGNLIATGSQDGSVRLWDGVTSEPLPARMGHHGPVTDLNFDPSGSFLISATENTAVRIWSVPSGNQVRGIGGFGSAATAALFVPDGSTNVLACTARGGVTIWNGASGEKVVSMRGHRDHITAAHFTRDGSRLLTASRDGTARLWDTATGQEMIEPLQHNNWVLSAEFDPKERLIVTSCQDGTVRFWSAKDGRPWGATLKHDGAVRSVAFSPSGESVATASLDVTARLWNPETGAMLCQPLWHGEMVTKALFAWGGSRLVTASSDRQVRIWDVTGRNYQPLTALETNHIHTLDVAPDGKSFAAATKEGFVWRCDMATGRPLAAPLVLDAAATGVAFSPDGQWLAVGGGRRHELQVWELSTGLPRFIELPRHDGVIRNASFSPEGNRLLTFSVDGTARIWDAVTGAAATPPLKHERDVYWAEFSPDGRLVATASLDSTARVWDATTGIPITGPLRHLDNVRHAAFSPDSSRLATASTDNHARIWNARTGELLADLPHARIVNCARFSPDGRLVATACIDRTARIWDANNGQALTPPMRHDHFVDDARFSPDGTRLLTCSLDGTIRLWDVKTGRPLTEPLLSGKSVGAYMPRFTPDGRRVVVARAGKGAAIWELPSTRVPVPPWFPEFAENLAGLRISAQENAELAPRTDVSEFLNTPELIPGDDYFAGVARWLVDDVAGRSPSPFSRIVAKPVDPNAASPNTGGSTQLRNAEQTPGPRGFHSVVWTGEEMIVWGGYDHRLLADGWRYHPASNRWQEIGPAEGALSPRYGHTAVWTGDEMILWGGFSLAGKYSNDGARYSPSSNRWTQMLPPGLPATPSIRAWHTAVWTGREMIVWGGEAFGGRRRADGARYNPAANVWTSIPGNLPNTPSARSHHTAVWTGRELIIWGGYDGRNALNDGARYDPVANRWTPIPNSLTATPAPRWNFAAAWTGRELIVWGGNNRTLLNDGGRYNPAENSWQTITTIDAPTARNGEMAVWTDTELIVWGGQDRRHTFNDGGRYDPVANRWTALPGGAPASRQAHTTVWTGREIIVWGGDGGGGIYLNDGGRFNPSANSWTAILPSPTKDEKRVDRPGQQQ